MCRLRVHSSAPAITLLLASSLAAQAARWNLPANGLARYLRTRTVRTEVLETKEPNPPEPNPDLGISVGQQNPPLLYESELDKKRRSISLPPRDIRDLPRHLAFDLVHGSAKGKRKYRISWMAPFGDLVIKASYEAPSAAGEQRLVCQLTSEEPKPGALPPTMPKDLFQDRVARRMQHRLEGELVITRVIDSGKGLVESFRSHLVGIVTYPADHSRRRARFTVHESWKLKEVIANRGGNFEARVATAIQKGRKWLLGRVAEPSTGALEDRADREGETRNSGRLALMLLTLVHAEADRNSPVLEKAYIELRRRVITDTYSLALAIMAVEILHAPINERRLILEGRLKGPGLRKVPERDRALIAQWSRGLLKNIDSRTDSGYRRRWSYTHRADYDNSNSQFAVLGLYSASLCGIEVNQAVWTTAARHFLDDQERAAEAKPIPLVLTTHEELAASRAKSRRTVAGGRAKPRGWPYRKDHEPYGSMTAGGIAALTLCATSLRQRKRYDRKLLAEIDKAIHSGFAWFAQHYTVLCNPSRIDAGGLWRLYYLYSLERACEFNHIARLMDYDWYFEGASLLFDWQRPDGTFPGFGYEGDITATCFAILFLKKAALPVYTGR